MEGRRRGVGKEDIRRDDDVRQKPLPPEVPLSSCILFVIVMHLKKLSVACEGT